MLAQPGEDASDLLLKLPSVGPLLYQVFFCLDHLDLADDGKYQEDTRSPPDRHIVGMGCAARSQEHCRRTQPPCRSVQIVNKGGPTVQFSHDLRFVLIGAIAI